MKILLNTGRINVNEVTCKGTALHIAAKNGKLCIVSHLIAHGADCSYFSKIFGCINFSKRIQIEEGLACEMTTNDKIKELIENSRLKAFAEVQRFTFEILITPKK